MTAESCRGATDNGAHVAAGQQANGVERPLTSALGASSEAGCVWTPQIGISLQSRASAPLREPVGFRLVGVREQFGRQHDVSRGLLPLERRSETIG